MGCSCRSSAQSPFIISSGNGLDTMSFLSSKLHKLRTRAVLQVSSVLTMCLGLSGCGGAKFQMAPVAGVCLCNGKPIEAGLVIFEPIPESGADLKESGRSASGMLQPDGSFVLSTFGKNDGAIVGRHKVLVYAPPLEDDDAPLTNENRFACGNQPIEENLHPGQNLVEVRLTHTPRTTRRR